MRLQFQLILSLPLLSYRSPNCCQPWLGLRSRSSCKAKRRHPATPSCLATASQRRLSSRHNRNSANHSSSNDRGLLAPRSFRFNSPRKPSRTPRLSGFTFTWLPARSLVTNLNLFKSAAVGLSLSHSIYGVALHDLVYLSGSYNLYCFAHGFALLVLNSSLFYTALRPAPLSQSKIDFDSRYRLSGPAVPRPGPTLLNYV